MVVQDLEKIITEYGKDIYSFCRHLACNVQEADDLYQDTFLKAIEQCEKIDGTETVKNYLLSIAVGLWKNRKRKYAWRARIAPMESLSEREDLISQEEGEALLEDDFLVKEEARIVRHQVMQLPDRLRICVLLFYMQELSVAEISDVLRIPSGTVKSRLHQARKQLKKDLENMI